MEILFVSHKYPPATGGMEKQSYELIRGMAALTKVHQLVYTQGESRICFFLSLEKRIKLLLSKNPGITIIHFNDGLIAAVSLLHTGYLYLKRSVTFHGLDVVFPSLLFQKVIFPKFNNFDLVFAVSSATATACRQRGISEEKTVVVKNGVDVSDGIAVTRTDIDDMMARNHGLDIRGKQVLMAIGRPVKRKGFSWFIKNVLPLLDLDTVLLLIGPTQDTTSFSHRFIGALPNRLKDKIELFLGSPSDERELRQLLEYPNQNPKVIRMGKLPLQEMNELLSVADAFVMPNIEVYGDMEGFGLVCLEACMQGAKVFAAASGGITDAIVHGKNGVLLPSGDAESWAAALNRNRLNQEDTLLSPDQIISFTTENFSWEKMSSEYHQHFLKL
ncbi:glycosyltransferase family 4 protein [Pedobacter sp. JCM 36344]|uniref:glycosyltransferase family 4 protein n=1 Tax=Pedobacter sp. JCM 36344 TaxID=3374280 RepID=UPI00397D84FA